ncbi:ABC transporter permease [Spongiactinospora sp. TRM90649]|uniref:ABC transporter permease n=1 Tax=Spongiactinospora sp. TRM90649 TaxID=3031114 RepID=UPI0023F73B76|nr:ABC transporter permease [Spongiactinospora sp. TRM90649]MDF5754212.1 ABC transporter permease [Spongiactinospora sp. TRM90649]
MTVITAPSAPAPAVQRLGWVLSDAWIIARSNLIHLTRNPGSLVGTLLYPIVMVLMFGYVFGSAMNVQGGGDYRAFLMPGMFAQTMAVGVTTTLVIVATQASYGVTDRFRSMPISQAGVVLGRALADLAISALELAALIGCGLVVGWGWHNGTGDALAGIGLLLLLRFSLTWVGIYVGLKTTPEAAGASWMLLLPLTMIANTFVSPSQMPAWLGFLAEWNPLSATVTACRALFGNPGLPGDSWAAEHALALAVAWPLLIILVFLPLSARAYRHLNR